MIVKARICREMEDVKDKITWKEEICKYSEEAFKLFNEDYEDVAKHIHGLLELHYEPKRWVVFLYEPPGDTLVWYSHGYCCTIECESTTGKKYYVALKCFLNEGTIMKSMKLTEEIPFAESLTIIDKGKVKVEDVIACFSSLLKPEIKELEVGKIQDMICFNGENYGLGTLWGVCKCKRGSIICALENEQYIMFQLGDYIYFCFRQE